MQGAAWLTAKQPVALGFDTTFRFQMSDGIADGFALVIQNHLPTALGPGGGGLGYGGLAHHIGLPNSIAVEFDTFADQLGELGPHISVQTNGTEPNHGLSTFSLGWTLAQQLSDGGEHFARIRYVPGTLTVYLDDLENPVLTTSLDLVSLLDLDDGSAWLGFTAGTGFEYQNHDILSWDYQTLADPAGQTSRERQRLAKALPQHVTRVIGESPRRSAPLSPEGGELLKEVLAFYQQFAQPDRATPETRLHLAQACWNLGAVHRQFNQVDAADKALGTAIQIWQGLAREFPDQPEYQDRLRFGELAIGWFGVDASRRAGRYDETIAPLEQKLAAAKATFGENRPHVLTLQSDLATAYLDAGRSDDAIALFRQTIAARAASLGDDDPHTLSSQHGLALAYYQSGRYEQAVALHQQTLASRKAHLGDDDPQTLRSQTNLALAYAKVGRHEEAIALQSQTLASQKAQLGQEHPDYASSLYVMATLHVLMLRYAKAESLFREALEIRRAVFGEQHPVYAGALDRLGDLYRRMDDDDRAEPLLEQALAIRRAALGERHPSCATSLQSLAELRQAQGDIRAAETFYRQAIDIRRETAPRHPDLAANLHALGVLLADNGNQEEAQSLLREALQIRHAAFGTQHPDHTETLRVLETITKRPL
jgi:tetratricopeptide (TPR) repeat protein